MNRAAVACSLATAIRRNRHTVGVDRDVQAGVDLRETGGQVGGIAIFPIGVGVIEEEKSARIS